jgi:hypothetical protein
VHVDSSYLGRLHPKTAIYGRIEYSSSKSFGKAVVILFRNEISRINSHNMFEVAPTDNFQYQSQSVDTHNITL